MGQAPRRLPAKRGSDPPIRQRQRRASGRRRQPPEFRGFAECQHEHASALDPTLPLRCSTRHSHNLHIGSPVEVEHGHHSASCVGSSVAHLLPFVPGSRSRAFVEQPGDCFYVLTYKAGATRTDAL